MKKNSKLLQNIKVWRERERERQRDRERERKKESKRERKRAREKCSYPFYQTNIDNNTCVVEYKYGKGLIILCGFGFNSIQSENKSNYLGIK